MCGAKGYGFWAILVWNRVCIIVHSGLKFIILSNFCIQSNFYPFSEIWAAAFSVYIGLTAMFHNSYIY